MPVVVVVVVVVMAAVMMPAPVPVVVALSQHNLKFPHLGFDPLGLCVHWDSSLEFGLTCPKYYRPKSANVATTVYASRP
jgi:hypothetical protein